MVTNFVKFLTPLVSIILLHNQSRVYAEDLVSPCPDILNYQIQDKSKNSWYASVNLGGLGAISQLKLTLDRPAEQVTSSTGNVKISKDNTYIISNINSSRDSLGFLVAYSEEGPIPSVSELGVDGKTICSSTLTRSSRQIFIDGFLRPEQSVLFNYEIDQLLCGVTAEQEYSLFRGDNVFKTVRFPWHAAIFYNDFGKLRYGCGGTLISRQFVLTAAHCIQGFARLALKANDVQIQLGRYDLNTESPGLQIHDVSDIIIHPSYSRINYANNLALIKLKTPVQYDDFVRPACLWKGDVNYDNLVGTTGTAAGWGLSEQQNSTFKLRDFDLTLISYKDCQLSDSHAYFQYQSGGLYCAGLQNGTSICQGDAGGGMVLLRNTLRGEVYFLRGVISAPKRFVNTCDETQNIRFTDVAKYLDFIGTYVK